MSPLITADVGTNYPTPHPKKLRDLSTKVPQKAESPVLSLSDLVC